MDPNDPPKEIHEVPVIRIDREVDDLLNEKLPPRTKSRFASDLLGRALRARPPRILIAREGRYCSRADGQLLVCVWVEHFRDELSVQIWVDPKATDAEIRALALPKFQDLVSPLLGLFSPEAKG